MLEVGNVIQSQGAEAPREIIGPVISKLSQNQATTKK